MYGASSWHPTPLKASSFEITVRVNSFVTMNWTSYLLVVLYAVTIFISSTVKPVQCAMCSLSRSTSQELPRKLGGIVEKSVLHSQDLTKNIEQLQMQKLQNPEDGLPLLSTKLWHAQSKWVVLPKGPTPPQGPSIARDPPPRL
ncbi:hypothetical protein O6H91_Y064100 [Diphasiastrum complanatum]|nr:hypothetical protein O6H91_Y064100 [Diphasiastrum complanatum]